VFAEASCPIDLERLDGLLDVASKEELPPVVEAELNNLLNAAEKSPDGEVLSAGFFGLRLVGVPRAALFLATIMPVYRHLPCQTRLACI